MVADFSALDHKYRLTMGKKVPCNLICSKHILLLSIVGRAEYFSNLIPGKVIKFWKGMFFPLLGKEVRNQTFEVLVTNNPGVLRWVPASSGIFSLSHPLG